MIATVSGAWATTVPHGSMTIERPYAGWPGGPPICEGARTNAPFSMARARRSTSQWSRPVRSVKFAGTVRISAPASGERAVQLREAKVVADRQADRRPVDVRGDEAVAGRHARRLGVDRPVVDRDIEEVDLAVRRRDRAVRARSAPRCCTAGPDPALVSAVLPTRIHASRRRATSQNGSVCGPGIGLAEARKPSSPPRYWRYSGRATSRAPPAAALSASSAARAIFAATSSVASVWTRATRRESELTGPW